MRKSLAAVALVVVGVLTACGSQQCNTGLYDADGNCVSQQQRGGDDDFEEDDD